MSSKSGGDKRFVTRAPVPSDDPAERAEGGSEAPSAPEAGSDTGQPDEQVAPVTQADLERLQRANPGPPGKGFRDEKGGAEPARKPPPRH
jgi:hypothetical protein